jgi:alpha-galactosidase
LDKHPAASGVTWSGPAYTVVVDGVAVTAETAGIEVAGERTDDRGDGVTEQVTTYVHPRVGIGVDWHVRHYADLAVTETWIRATNLANRPVTVDRLDSIGFRLPAAEYELSWFESSWGLEFEPVRERLRDNKVLQTLSGRSSQGHHPCFTLHRADGALLRGCAVWSGNWVFRFERQHDGGYVLTGGLHDEGFGKVLQPGAGVDAPPVAVTFGLDHGADTAALDLARAARRHWAPRAPAADFPLVEWNHWWPYEDHSIDEQTFQANADVAAELGVEVCTLDAGWFGSPDATATWWELRGDWDVVNEARFPNGIAALADYVHDRGMRFGVWCEIEALGPKATLAARRPDFPALREGAPLRYVCLGNPAAAEWAYQTLNGLARAGADWIKLDFNLDPGLGCDRTDHGHGAGDGLFDHYNAYYRVLERVRGAHPDLVLENCSSGGLRVDLGILRQTHLTFLSDPDWPEHGLQVLWGALTMLPPNQLLHWGFSQWHGPHAQQTFDPAAVGLRAHQVDYYRRIAMLGAAGLSYRLPDLPAPVRDRIAANIVLYKEIVRPFVATADVHRLTEQPRRFGAGSRWAAFQFSQPGGADHLVFAFRLPGGERTRGVPLRGLDPAAMYDVEPIGGITSPAGASSTSYATATRERRSGADLATTGLRAELPEEGSQLWRVRIAPA